MTTSDSQSSSCFHESVFISRQSSASSCPHDSSCPSQCATSGVSISLAYSWSTRHVLAGTCVHAHIWAVCTWLSLSPECFCCMCVGSQASCGRLLLNLVPRVPGMSFSTGLSLITRYSNRAVCVSVYFSQLSCCLYTMSGACILCAILPCFGFLYPAPWKGQDVWVTTPLMPPHTRSCVPLWSPPDPFPDLFPYC